MHKLRHFAALMCLVFLVSCGEEKTPEPPKMILKQAAFSDLPGWGEDQIREVVPAFLKSCERILKKSDKTKALGPLAEAGTYGDWQGVCEKFLTLAAHDDANFQTYFEENFQPYAVMADNEPEGLFTGYYEASLRGSREKKEPYVVPLYVRPDDLVMVDLGAFREELKGQRIAGRVEDGNLRPYETREEIVAGKWPHNDKVVVWVDDPVDAFYVQIQGSGVVTFEDGSTMRIGYAGQNGHPYTAIGKELIARGALTKENVSMASIRDWLEAHKDEADAVMNTNKSYVFFTQLDGEGPVGGEGVVLTPGRSLAVDRSLMPYGVPLWVDIEHPGDVQALPLRRMMIAQDTGGAIRGAVRGDFFWGYGPEAEAMAGPMKSKGKYWVLVPK